GNLPINAFGFGGCRSAGSSRSTESWNWVVDRGVLVNANSGERVVPFRMDYLPYSTAQVLRKVARRVALGQFLQIWPSWGTGAFLIAGLVALLCRMFFPNAAHLLPFVWAAPLLSVMVTACLTLRSEEHTSELQSRSDLV